MLGLRLLLAGIRENRQLLFVGRQRFAVAACLRELPVLLSQRVGGVVPEVCVEKRLEFDLAHDSVQELLLGLVVLHYLHQLHDFLDDQVQLELGALDPLVVPVLLALAVRLPIQLLIQMPQALCDVLALHHIQDIVPVAGRVLVPDLLCARVFERLLLLCRV